MGINENRVSQIHPAALGRIKRELQCRPRPRKTRAFSFKDRVIIGVMRDEILQKLRKELQNGVGSEAQAVYLMAEVRKILEHDNAEKTYAALYLFCNWVLHTTLDRGFAKDIVSLVDDIHGGGAKYDPAIENRWKELHDLTDGQALRQELREFLTRNGLPTYITDDDDWWRLFFSHYASAISDTPLSVNGTGRFVKQLLVRTKKAARRAGNDHKLPKPVRDAFKLVWLMTTVAGEETMIMSVEFPEDWFGPMPRYTP
jgi:hypothetical protein